MLYVERLVAPDVINTVPEATIRAFADHGDSTREIGERLRRAQRAGVDLPLITADLEQEGVSSFCDSSGERLDCIQRKLQVLTRAGATG